VLRRPNYKSAGAAPDQNIPENTTRQFAGEDAVYYVTKLSGASNHQTKRLLNFKATDGLND
jgi:2-alkyl-3-oxoalkanoate reductase